jgi:hypothetical protein
MASATLFNIGAVNGSFISVGFAIVGFAITFSIMPLFYQNMESS